MDISVFTREPCMLTSFIAAMLLSSSASGGRCELVSSVAAATESAVPTRADSMPARNLIAATSWIVRAKAVAKDTAMHSGASVASGVTFDVIEVLKAPGGASLKSFTVVGHAVNRDDFNRQPVPYWTVRPSGQRGTCFAEDYRLGAQYLVFLTGAPGDGTLTPYWAPLLPTNEQIRESGDPWLKWVGNRLDR